MNENEYCVAIWRTAAAAFSVVVLTIGGCTVNQSNKIAELVKGGTDPIKAECAITGIASSNIWACVAVGMKP